MNDLQIFNNEQFGKIRAVEVSGEPWFCLADVCKPLGLQAKHCKERLRPDGVVTTDLVDSAGRSCKMLVINEGNLYRTIFQSKKPEAEAFTDWVTEEVLPTLRKKGTFTVPGKSRIPEGISLGGLAKLLSVTRRIMLDMGNTPVEIGAVARGLYETCGVPLHEAFSSQIPGQLCMFEGPSLGSGSTEA